LLVDEVLAVGDLAFQKKCLGKMGEVARQGRTVLFVSHNLGAVEHLCTRAILFQDGCIQIDSTPDCAIEKYLISFSDVSDSHDLSQVQREPGLIPIIQKLDFLDQNGRPLSALRVGDPLTVHIHYKHSESLKDPYFGLIFETVTGVRVFWVQTRLQRGTLPDLPRSGTIVCHIPRVPLIPGTYFVQPGCGSGAKQLDGVPRGKQLHVVEADVFGTGRLPQAVQGLVIVEADWKIA
jgi:lipopolysaccharide transport system ATP-binding protein